jgi:hypothetical protein
MLGYRLPSWLHWSYDLCSKGFGFVMSNLILNQRLMSIPQNLSLQGGTPRRRCLCTNGPMRMSLAIHQSRCNRSPIGTPYLAEDVVAISSLRCRSKCRQLDRLLVNKIAIAWTSGPTKTATNEIYSIMMGKIHCRPPQPERVDHEERCKLGEHMAHEECFDCRVCWM